jgi:hypothetical protein
MLLKVGDCWSCNVECQERDNWSWRLFTLPFHDDSNRVMPSALCARHVFHNDLNPNISSSAYLQRNRREAGSTAILSTCRRASKIPIVPRCSIPTLVTQTKRIMYASEHIKRRRGRPTLEDTEDEKILRKRRQAAERSRKCRERRKPALRTGDGTDESQRAVDAAQALMGLR